MTLGRSLVQPSRVLTGYQPIDYLSPKDLSRVITFGSFKISTRFAAHRIDAQEMIMILLFL